MKKAEKVMHGYVEDVLHHFKTEGKNAWDLDVDYFVRSIGNIAYGSDIFLDFSKKVLKKDKHLYIFFNGNKWIISNKKRKKNKKDVIINIGSM